jgi:hypothetical protein
MRRALNLTVIEFFSEHECMLDNIGEKVENQKLPYKLFI